MRPQLQRISAKIHVRLHACKTFRLQPAKPNPLPRHLAEPKAEQSLGAIIHARAKIKTKQQTVLAAETMLLEA